jgi:Ring finger domain
VALLVERGDCSFEQKAYVAMKAFPAVSYMIVYDNEPSNDLVSMRETTSADNVTLGMLFISYRAGAALRTALGNQTRGVMEAGGPTVHLNGLEPLFMHQPSLADLQTWILIAMSGFFCFVVVFGCILVFVQLGVIPVNGAGQIILTQEALRRSRRLLTMEEVARLQVGGDLHNHVAASARGETPQCEDDCAESLEEKGQQKATIDNPEGAAEIPTIETECEEDHSCAVCLDELLPTTEGGTCSTLCLPCKHNFHVDCIVPWLTERHATCPLCKFDVMQFIMDLDEQSKPTRGWSSLSRYKERARNMLRVGWSPVQSNDSQSGSSATESIEEHEISSNGAVDRGTPPIWYTDGLINCKILNTSSFVFAASCFGKSLTQPNFVYKPRSESMQSTSVAQFERQFANVDLVIAHISLSPVIVHNIALRATRANSSYNSIPPPVVIIVDHQSGKLGMRDNQEMKPQIGSYPPGPL